MDAVAGTPSSGRDDCWSEDATFTLIESWGDRFLQLNRGNLRQKHWQEVANAVNDRHVHVSAAGKPQPFRTDIQCKNRIDTLKKKYKIEKARVLDSGGSYTSSWLFFPGLDALLGPNFPTAGTSPPVTIPKFTPPALAISPIPVGPRSATPRRPASLTADDSSFRRNFSAFAAAAAAAAASAEENCSESSRSSGGSGSTRRRKRTRTVESEVGYRELADAIDRLGEIYKRVEERKQKQMVELEKHRMQFAKDLECQRMQLFVETQVQLHKLKRAAAKRSSAGKS